LRVPKLPRSGDAAIRTAQGELQLEARIRTLQKRSAAVPSNDDLNAMIVLLTKHSIDKKITYVNFKRVGACVPQRCRQFFQPSIFLYFQRDECERISIHSLCQYIIAAVKLEQAWVNLSLYDGDRDERVSEDDMIRYVSDFLDNESVVRDYLLAFPPLRNIYVLSIVRKFFFLLDPLGKGSIRIQTLITHPIFKELKCLRKGEDSLAETSWFTLNHTNHVYNKFLELDADGNGQLSDHDLRAYDPCLTNTFIAQLLASRPTINGELDFREFLNLELAVANPNTPQGLRYFFTVFDLEQKGYITEHDLAYFLKDVLEGLDETQDIEPGEEGLGSGKVFAEDVQNQIFDMVRPKTPGVITMGDLLHCGAAHIFCSILSSRDIFDNWEQNDGIRVTYQRKTEGVTDTHDVAESVVGR
jgi:Ca2+-binding EF-hand superfamily protein